jgi:hypothetical protein
MYKSLLRRFDTKKFVRINTRWYNNDSICPLCNKYNCNNCPIRAEKTGLDCYELIQKIATPRGGRLFGNLINLRYDNEKGKKQIDRIHSFLRKQFKNMRSSK